MFVLSLSPRIALKNWVPCSLVKRVRLFSLPEQRITMPARSMEAACAPMDSVCPTEGASDASVMLATNSRAVGHHVLVSFSLPQRPTTPNPNYLSLHVATFNAHICQESSGRQENMRDIPAWPSKLRVNAANAFDRFHPSVFCLWALFWRICARRLQMACFDSFLLLWCVGHRAACWPILMPLGARVGCGEKTTAKSTHGIADSFLLFKAPLRRPVKCCLPLKNCLPFESGVAFIIRGTHSQANKQSLGKTKLQWKHKAYHTYTSGRCKKTALLNVLKSPPQNFSTFTGTCGCHKFMQFTKHPSNFNGSCRINFTDKCQQLGSSVCRNGYCVARPYGDYECRCQYGYEQAADRKSCHMNMNPYLSKSKSICLATWHLRFFQPFSLSRGHFEASVEAFL